MQQQQLEVEVQRLKAELKETNSQAAMQQLQLETEEGKLADLQGHFNALLQVLSRRCLNNRD
jgi:hypothetical protein